MEEKDLSIDKKMMGAVSKRQKQKKHKGFASKRRAEVLFLIAFLTFPVIHKCFFYIGSNFSSFALAFQRWDVEKRRFVWNGWNNFRNVIDDLKYSVALRQGMKNTLWLYLMDTFLVIPISLLCSFFVVKKVPGYGTLKVIFFLPSLVSGVVMTLMYKYFCEYAIPELALKLFGVQKFPYILSEYPYAFPMMMLYCLWTGFANGIVLYVGSMSKVPEGVTDAAQIDGVTIMGEFWHVTMPTVWPMLSVFLITGLVGLFTGGGPIFTFYQYSAPSYCYTTGYFLFTKVMGDTASNLTYPYPAAVGMIVTVIVAPLTFLLRFLLEKYGPSEE